MSGTRRILSTRRPMTYAAGAATVAAADPSFALDLDTASDQSGLLSATDRALISEGSDFTVELSFKPDNSSGTEALLGVTNNTNDRIALHIEGTDMRYRIYDAGTTKAKSGSIGTRTDSHTVVITNDASGDAIKMWLDGSELTGGSSTSVSGVVGGYVGAPPSGVDFGSFLTFTGLIWGFKIYTSKIATLGALSALTPARLYSFKQTTSTTSADEQGSGEVVTWVNSPSFVDIPS